MIENLFSNFCVGENCRKRNFMGVEIATLNLHIKIQYPEFMDSEIVSYEYLILRVWGRHGYFSLSKVHGC